MKIIWEDILVKWCCRLIIGCTKSGRKELQIALQQYNKKSRLLQHEKGIISLVASNPASAFREVPVPYHDKAYH